MCVLSGSVSFWHGLLRARLKESAPRVDAASAEGRGHRIMLLSLCVE